MNKIKILCLTILLIIVTGSFSYSGGFGVNAVEQASYYANIKNPKIKDNTIETSFQDGGIILKLTRNTEEKCWDVDITYNTYRFTPSTIEIAFGDNYIYTIDTNNDVLDVEEHSNGTLTIKTKAKYDADTIKEAGVYFSILDDYDNDGYSDFKSGDPIPPKEEVDDPVTGDKSMLMIAGLVILAGLSLYLIKTE